MQKPSLPLALPVFLICVFLLSSCSEEATEPDPAEESIPLDQILLGKWESTDQSATIEFTKISPTKGEGVQVLKDMNGQCDNYPWMYYHA